MKLRLEFQKILDGFAGCLREKSDLTKPQDALLAATGARATGLWKLEGDRLVLLGFRAVPDMPEDVKAGFAEATASVPLDQTGLGIVKAAVARRPATAQAGGKALGGSATWLQRFGARQSLALPVLDGERVLGVIAISSPEPFDERSPAWRLLEKLAEALAPAMRLLTPPGP